MAVGTVPGLNQIVDAILYGLKEDGKPLVVKVTSGGAILIESSSTDPSLTTLQKIANEKASEAIGSQQTDVGGIAGGVFDQYLGMVDLQDASYHDISLEVRIQQLVPSDESAKDFTLFWAFCSESLSNPSSDAPTQLQPSEFSLICDLVDASGGDTTRYYQTSVLQPKARYLYVWYDCDEVHIELDISNVSGTFQAGEEITGGTSGATGIIATVAANYLVVDVSSGTFQEGETITGGTSSATATIDSIIGGITVDVTLNKLS